MQDDRFEWFDAKAASNLIDHGVDFRDACLVFDDPAAIDELDDREDYGEERSLILGLANGQLLLVCYTERDDRKRIISARKATRREHTRYFKRQGA